MDFHIGGVDHSADEQAAMLNEMLADAEADDEFRAQEAKVASPAMRRSIGARPAAQASAYDVDIIAESESDGEDGFGPDSPNLGQTDAAGALQQDPHPSGFAWTATEPVQQVQRIMELEQEVGNRREQVRKLGVMLEALAPVPGVDAERLLNVMEGQDVEQADPRDIKIVYLAKKGRGLRLENNKLRLAATDAERKARQDEIKIKQLQEQIEVMASPAARAVSMERLAGGSDASSSSSSSATSALSLESDARATRDDAPSSSAAGVGEAGAALRRKDQELVEARRRVSRALDESKKLRGALTRELGLAPGEELPKGILQPNSSANGDTKAEKPFKGRAETIVLLRSKCKRLEADLERATGRKDPKATARREQRDVDRAASEDLRRMEDARRGAMEQLTENYEQLGAHLGATKAKLEASKARGAVLESENAKFRKQMKMLLSKGDNDDALVSELQAELQALRLELHQIKQQVEAQRSGRAYGNTRTVMAGTRRMGSAPGR